ncbi:hypothetical protein AMECASPLE_032300 [Ameca splendens]|uniref:Uncharacterized protein n=1 Tax=Ameca splendens TaxID=208324 RepID=A0ABV1AF13_9TELE
MLSMGDCFKFKWVMGKMVPICSSLWAGVGAHPGQVASPSQGNTQTTKHTPKGNLDRPVNLTGMSLDCGRKLGYPESTHASKGRNSMQKEPRPGVKPRTFLLQGNSAANCATVHTKSYS